MKKVCFVSTFNNKIGIRLQVGSSLVRHIKPRNESIDKATNIDLLNSIFKIHYIRQ